MRYTSITVASLFLFASLNVLFGQAAKTSSQIQQGFHYHLKKRALIDYNSEFYPSFFGPFIVKAQDKLQRYFDSNRRLRISITQNDSGRLTVKFREMITIGPYIGAPVPKTIDNTTNCRPIARGDNADSFYFQIPARIKVSNFTYYKTIGYSTTQYGATLIPFIYRPNRILTSPSKAVDTAISSSSMANLNLALYIGRKWGWTKFYFNKDKTHEKLYIQASLFGGVQSLSLNAQNSFDAKGGQTPLVVSTGLAVTSGIGAITVGLFMGHDMGGITNWVYRGQPLWFGFGIGVNLGLFSAAGDLSSPLAQ